ncbi:haloacid dehalogenase [Paenibacillus sp. PCH8]|uniref:HAD family hydrolase n=1 Tax=Paenibacillus sp. PCH8 TaxID=2066524 RepID=UPI000CF9E3FB|nr:HAD family hydrolase [Paenibacillus sp. PCH8]PQP84246.1 haloacid dehalogenase [Paenibacillus sp. PCH8]
MQENTLTGELPYPIQAILFDKDGTLLDFTGMWGFWTDCVLNDFGDQLAVRGLRLDTAELPQIWGTYHDDQGRMNGYDIRGPLAMGTMDEVYAVLTWHGYRAGLSWAEAKIMVRACLAHAEEEMEQHRPARPLPGVREFLEQSSMEGIILGVVTADDTASAIKHLEWMGLDSFFDVVIGTDLVERGKPFPDMLQLACERLNISVQNTVVIGDTDGDMEMARTAGAGYRIGIGEPGRIHFADRTIQSFHELLNGGLNR